MERILGGSNLIAKMYGKFERLPSYKYNSVWVRVTFVTFHDPGFKKKSCHSNWMIYTLKPPLKRYKRKRLGTRFYRILKGFCREIFSKFQLCQLGGSPIETAYGETCPLRICFKKSYHPLPLGNQSSLL